MKIHPDANFSRLLRDSVKSYNNSYSKVLKGTPSSLNSNYFDPVLRERLYGHHNRLQPFEHWFKNQIRLQKKSLKSRKGRLRNNDDFRVNDLVLVQFQGLTKVQKRHWSQRTETELYRIARVNTIGICIYYLSKNSYLKIIEKLLK